CGRAPGRPASGSRRRRRRGSPPDRAAPGGPRSAPRAGSRRGPLIPLIPKQIGERSAHLGFGGLRRARGVDDVEAWIGGGQLQEAAAHPLVETEVLGVQTVGGTPLLARQGVAAGAGRRRRQVEE